MKAALAAADFVGQLQEELGVRANEQYERLFLYEGADPVWAQNIWRAPHRLKFQSISEAAKHLRGIQRNWVLYSCAAHRRAQLIQDQLPPLKFKPIEFLSPVPQAPLGSWTLLDKETMLYSASCTSPFPHGEVEFVENKTGPPSRAYLKLWEFFTLLGQSPRKGERVLDLGACPGGWSWVLSQLECEVTSVDKAPLADSVMRSKHVKFINESAFALDPKAIGAVDWLFSDIICYPERLLELIRKWEGSARNMVCTVKFQGPTDFAAVNELQKISGSRLQHLHCNKHELTWSRLSR